MTKTFSERIGIEPAKSIQKNDIDDALKNKLWNALLMYFFSKFTESYNAIVTNINESNYFDIIKFIWTDFFNKPIDTIPYECNRFIYECRVFFFNEAAWNQIYDFIQFLLSSYRWSYKKAFVLEIKKVLKKENSAYTVIGNEIVPITDEQEIQEIEEALEASKGRFNGVHTHLKSALHLLSDRKNPNYRKSIDESIMAVESICVLICQDDKATLGKALNKIEREGKIRISGTLKSAYSQIYGYTSDNDGIRHAMTEESTLDYEDAKYMLVSCTSFVNYLIVKAEKAGVFSESEDGGEK